MLSKKDIDKQFIKILSKVKNYHDSQDVLSESLLSFCKHQKKINDEDAELKYFKTIVKSKIVDYFRHKAKNKISAIDLTTLKQETDFNLIEMGVVLDKLEYEVFALRYNLGYTKGEIKKLLNLSSSEYNGILNSIKSKC